jgi:hypothetical protein
MTAGARHWRGVSVVTGIVCALSVGAAAGAAPAPIVEPYLRIQQALSADSLDGHKDHAREIVLEAGKLGEAGEVIRTAAGDLLEAADLKSARAAFGRIGNAIMTWAAESGATLGDDVHVAYCPMARKYWLQKGEDIRNPFYGASMADCGRLVPTLPNLRK